MKKTQNNTFPASIFALYGASAGGACFIFPGVLVLGKSPLNLGPFLGALS